MFQCLLELHNFSLIRSFELSLRMYSNTRHSKLCLEHETDNSTKFDKTWISYGESREIMRSVVTSSMHCCNRFMWRQSSLWRQQQKMDKYVTSLTTSMCALQTQCLVSHCFLVVGDNVKEYRCISEKPKGKGQAEKKINKIVTQVSIRNCLFVCCFFHFVETVS